LRDYGWRVIVDQSSPEWPRKQVADRIRRQIADGEIGPRLPSHMDLAERLGVAPKTVERALAILKDEGLIYSVPGRGTFVA
jgi:DNA-binding GntR family transcriptional regulator